MKTMFDNIFSGNLPGLEKAMDLTWRRNEAIASNVANAETPGYRAVDLNFGSELQRAFDRYQSPVMKTNSMHLDVKGGSEAHRIQDLSGMTKADGNNVDIDIQMGQLAFNRSRYSQASTFIRKKFAMLTSAIKTA